MRQMFIASALVCFATATAGAQTKVVGTAQFGKPDSQHVIPVGDRPDHSLEVVQTKCTWSKSMEIGGAKSKDGVNTETSEIHGNTVQTRGSHVSTMDSGDKFFVSYQGSTTTKEGALQSGKGNWAFTGGTGKLKGIKGKGTYTCAPSGDMISCDVEGEYQLPK
jgi:hypothetical protein